MMRIERFLWVESAWIMLGSLIVATEPEQARRRWRLLSLAWSAALRMGAGGNVVLFFSLEEIVAVESCVSCL